MSWNRAIPQVPSLGLMTLFRFGPWEVLVPFLVAGMITAAAWIASPMARVAFIADWRFAGAAGAALAAMVAVAGFSRIWWDIRHGVPFIVLSAAAGFATLTIASQTIFFPPLVQASPCAPSIAAEMPGSARIASYVLPLLLLGAWTLYLLSRFPVIATVDQVTPGATGSRYGSYARAIQRLLPFRVFILVAAIGLSVFFLKRFLATPDGASPAHTLERLRRPAFAMLDLERGGPAFAQLAATRSAAEQRAMAFLQDLDLDRAAPAVHECSCTWLTPRDAIGPQISEAAAGFAALDEDLASTRWRPTAATAAALLKIVPLGSGNELPLFAQQWIDTGGANVVGTLETKDVDTTYRGETVLRTRRTYGFESGQRRLVSVAIEFLGRGTRDSVLLAGVTKKMQRPPDEGPCVISQGSLCASWNVDRLRLRIRPAVPAATSPAEVNEETPLWIVLSAVEDRCCPPQK